MKKWRAALLLVFMLTAIAVDAGGASSARAATCPRIKFTSPSAYTGVTRVVAGWVAAWRAKNFKGMAALSEISWRRRTPGAASVLRDQYGFKDVVGFRVMRTRKLSTVAARVTFRVDYRTFKLYRVLITAMVVREDRGGNPSPVGSWGVNPTSTLAEKPACS
jgi:hypothetical protein